MNPKSFLGLLYMQFLLDRHSQRFSHKKCLIVSSGRNIRIHNMLSLPNFVRPISIHPLYRFFFFVIHCRLRSIFCFISTSDHYSTLRKLQMEKQNKTNKNTHKIEFRSHMLLQIDKVTCVIDFNSCQLH